MKRGAFMMLLALLFCRGALAELALDGSVIAGESREVCAPFGGIVEEIYLRPGDLVCVGDSVASIATTRIYAPQDGTVVSVFAQEGDSADRIVERYGAVLYMEPVNRYSVQASTEKAYNSSETKYVHIGEWVYLRCTKDGTHRGTARVTKVEAAEESGYTNFTLEVTGGDFYIGETVSAFRSEDCASSSRIGRGIVGQATPVGVKGEGSILKLHVSPGEVVERGQLLFETVAGALDGLYAGNSIIASNLRGIVASVDAQSGSEIEKNQSLITVYPFDSLQIEARVNVLDLCAVRAGKPVEIEFDLDSEGPRRCGGRIESISYLNANEGDQTYYSAYISFEADERVRLGMPAIVYLDAEEGAADEG